MRNFFEQKINNTKTANDKNIEELINSMQAGKLPYTQVLKTYAVPIAAGSAASVLPFFFTKNPIIRVISGTALYGLTSFIGSKFVSDKIIKRVAERYGFQEIPEKLKGDVNKLSLIASGSATLAGLPIAGATMGLGFLTDHLINKLRKRRNLKK